MITDKRKFRTYLYKTIVASLTGIVIIFLLTILFITVYDKKIIAGKIYPNVYVEGIAFGGKNKQEVIDFFNKKNRHLQNKAISVIYQKETVATFSGRQLALAYDSEGIAQRAYLIGRSPYFLSNLYQKIASILKLTRFDFSAPINWDKHQGREFIGSFEEKYNRPAKNALFKFEEGRVMSFRQEEKGLMIESEKFLSDFEKSIYSLSKEQKNQKVIVQSRVIEPEITLSKANSLGIEEFIAEGKSNFSHSISERIHNIILASSKFNGILIPPNEVFSFNKTVGDISSLTGYKPAYIIKGGKTVLGDGGGVCQVSTTLFRAALNAGLPIVERTAHAYRVGYYENDSKPGFDATVFDPVDLKIKNDTPAHILIQTEVDTDNYTLTFRFYGKKDNREVFISPVTIYDVQPPPPPVYQDDPTLKKGEEKQIDFPAWGSKVTFDYKVTKNGQTTFEKSFFSDYRPWQAVYLKGTAE